MPESLDSSTKTPKAMLAWSALQYLSWKRQAADASRKLSDDLLALIANVLFKGDNIQKVEKLVADGEKKCDGCEICVWGCVAVKEIQYLI